MIFLPLITPPPFLGSLVVDLSCMWKKTDCKINSRYSRPRLDSALEQKALWTKGFSTQSLYLPVSHESQEESRTITSSDNDNNDNKLPLFQVKRFLFFVRVQSVCHLISWSSSHLSDILSTGSCNFYTWVVLLVFRPVVYSSPSTVTDCTIEASSSTSHRLLGYVLRNT